MVLPRELERVHSAYDVRLGDWSDLNVYEQASCRSLSPAEKAQVKVLIVQRKDGTTAPSGVLLPSASPAVWSVLDSQPVMCH